VRSGSQGFTLIEVVVAIALLSTAVVTTAGLLVIGAKSVSAARMQTWATLLATDKLEALRATAWTDLDASPSGTLTRDVPGFVDYLSARGEPADAGAAVYVRRWSISPLVADAANALVLQVVVWPGPVRLATVRTRQGA
jgi:prepilin-type N-terminal cleavage/methylation domain-containing protein